MKAIIGRAFGALGLGAALLVTGCREASSVASAATTPAGTIVNCGEGRQAVVHPVTAGSGASQIECVPVAGARAYTMAYAPGTTAMPVVASEAPAPERVVYRTAPARERVVYRTAPEPVVHRGPAAEPAVYRTSGAEPVAYPDRSSYPARSTDRYPVEEERKSPRSWKKSAIIIGGAAAGGAGLGAIIDGGNGAKKGAVIGGVAGTIFDLATRNK